LIGSVSSYSQVDESEDKSKKKRLSLKDPEDGALDISAFVESAVGFFPVPIIITEPAIGYGGGAALLYFHKPKNDSSKQFKFPNITGIAGGATQNGTWFGAALHMHNFGDDRVRTLSLAGKPYINIKYYGNNSEILSRFPVELQMDSWLFFQEVQLRLAESRWFAGLSYLFFTTDIGVNAFQDIPPLNELFNKLRGESTISQIKPRINFDSRNNIFTPTKGFDAGVSLAHSATWLGSDDDFTVLNTYLINYTPITENLFSAWRFDGSYLLGSAPLYALPFISLRGVPVMRYQSENVLVFETEWRYEFLKRYSIVGFTGGGTAFQSFEDLDKTEWAYTVGTGIRRLMARKFGIQTGLDFAWGNGQDFAFYIVFGTSLGK
jgi:hypothetical protein